MVDSRTSQPVDDDAVVIEHVIKRYFANKNLIEAVAEIYDIRTLFVWQPVPTYKYDDEKFHLYLEGGYGQHMRSRYGYATLASLFSTQGQDENYVWLADIQANQQKPLYVDKVHYTAAFSQRIALHIAEEIRPLLTLALHAHE